MAEVGFCLVDQEMCSWGVPFRLVSVSCTVRSYKGLTEPLMHVFSTGDQVYNDLVWAQPALAAWGKLSEPSQKLKAKWTAEMEAQAVQYYCGNYIDTLSTTNIATAMACIPQVMLWDDHDIWDGWGSYRDEVQATEVFQSLFKVARRFFLLFQKHTAVELVEKEGEYLLPKYGAGIRSLDTSDCMQAC